jgi:hypothetical protein
MSHNEETKKNTFLSCGTFTIPFLDRFTLQTSIAPFGWKPAKNASTCSHLLGSGKDFHHFRVSLWPKCIVLFLAFDFIRGQKTTGAFPATEWQRLTDQLAAQPSASPQGIG